MPLSFPGCGKSTASLGEPFPVEGWKEQPSNFGSVVRAPSMNRPDCWFGPCLGALRFTAVDAAEPILPESCVEDDSLLCTICCEVLIQPVQLPCGGFHVFCHRCVQQWCHRNLSCPCCRGDIKTWHSEKFSNCKADDLVHRDTEELIVQRCFGGSLEAYQNSCPESSLGRFSWTLSRGTVRSIMHHVCFGKTRSFACRSQLHLGSIFRTVFMGFHVETKSASDGSMVGRARIGVWCQHHQESIVSYAILVGLNHASMSPMTVQHTESCNLTQSGEFWDDAELTWSNWIPLHSVLPFITNGGRLKLGFRITDVRPRPSSTCCLQ
mmetsp:Transcript_72494/g.193299  ORF Transcript_72494/g.193299 Transcript_72494/m.193299 type:complete len:323 (+) Transcript_72494:47-1015(+)